MNRTKEDVFKELEELGNEETKKVFVKYGWSTLSYLVAVKEDAVLELNKLEELLYRVEKEVYSANKRVSLL